MDPRPSWSTSGDPNERGEAAPDAPERSPRTSFAPEKPTSLPVSLPLRARATEASSGLEVRHRSPYPDLPATVLSPFTVTETYAVDDNYTQNGPASLKGIH